MTDKTCIFCSKNKANYRSHKQVVVNNQVNTQYYCATCANNAIAFGWLDSEELHEI